MVATNIRWTEAPFEMRGFYLAESEAALRKFMKDYDVIVTGTGKPLHLDGKELRFYDFTATLKKGCE
jgi:hypothetical protein